MFQQNQQLDNSKDNDQLMSEKSEEEISQHLSDIKIDNTRDIYSKGNSATLYQKQKPSTFPMSEKDKMQLKQLQQDLVNDINTLSGVLFLQIKCKTEEIKRKNKNLAHENIDVSNDATVIFIKDTVKAQMERLSILGKMQEGKPISQQEFRLLSEIQTLAESPVIKNYKNIENIVYQSKNFN